MLAQRSPRPLPTRFGTSLLCTSLLWTSLLGTGLLGSGCSQLRGRSSPETVPGVPSATVPGVPSETVPGVPSETVPGVPSETVPGVPSATGSTANFNADRPQIKLVYGSDSGRLNLLALAGPQTNRQVSHPSATPPGIPDFARCRLALVSPHPQGKAGYALANLVVLPEADEPTGLGLGSLWAGLTGDDARRTSSKDLALEVWTMELPQWQVEQLVERLKRDDFFKRQRVFNAEVELATEINGTRFAKPSPPIAELDGLIFRVRREGRLLRRRADAQAAVATRSELPELLRLPPVGMN